MNDEHAFTNIIRAAHDSTGSDEDRLEDSDELKLDEFDDEFDDESNELKLDEFDEEPDTEDDS
jgi:hypothetical protein